MIELKGRYNTAKVFTDNIEQEAVAQIIELCNQEFCKDSKIRIMPDAHAGAGCTIGTTMTIQDKVVPNLVGVDIGCGMEVAIFKEKNVDLKKLDKIITKFVPSGFDIRKKEHEYVKLINFAGLRCKSYLKLDRAGLSIGTLGGGNHFIELNKDSNGNIYLVVHSGSRYLGKQVAEYYQNLAFSRLTDLERQKLASIERLKSEGRKNDNQKELKKLTVPKINKALAHLEGEDFEDYLNDMRIVQRYAYYNRKAIINEIIKKMGLTVVDSFTTIHNYIDIETKILRKGAISAKAGEKVIVPINMRDGSLIAVGKGNEDWNYSAPHGAGRLMSRSKAKKTFSLDEFKKSMEGIYTNFG